MSGDVAESSYVVRMYLLSPLRNPILKGIGEEGGGGEYNNTEVGRKSRRKVQLHGIAVQDKTGLERAREERYQDSDLSSYFRVKSIALAVFVSVVRFRISSARSYPDNKSFLYR